MNYNYYSLSLLVLLFSAISRSPAFASLDSLCNDIAKSDPENVRREFCVSEMEEFYITENKTAPQLGALSFTITMAKYESGYSRISLILQQAQKLNQSTETALKDCLDVYLGVGAELLEGRSALKRGDFSTAENKASAALKAADICGSSVKNMRDMSKWISVFMKINNDFRGMAAISLGFAKLLPRVN